MKAYISQNDLFADIDLGIKNAVLMCIEGPKKAAASLCDQLSKTFISAGYEEAGKVPGDLVVYFVVKKSLTQAFINAAAK